MLVVSEQGAADNIYSTESLQALLQDVEMPALLGLRLTMHVASVNL